MSPVVWALIRPRPGNGGLTLLQLIASAVTTVLAFATTILAARFWGTPDGGADDTGGGYRLLALALVGLLLVPLLTLGTSAARLAARSRDDRLATLRLLGLSAGRVRFLAVAECTLTQALGVGAGVVLSLPLPVALSFLPVQGARATVGELWLPVWASASLVVLLVAIAAISAVLGLRRVVLSPLGVRARTDAPRLSPLRLVMGVIAVGAGIALTQLASPSWGVTGITLALAVAVLLVMGVLGVVGPFAVTLVFRARVRRTSDPAVLVAARRNLEGPRAAWRQVSTIALTSFLLVPAGAMLGFLDAVQRSSTVLTEAQLTLFTDARTMLLALVGVSFVVVACQVAITQTSALWEHRDLYVALDRIGMPRAVMHRARRIQATAPVLLATIGGAGAATVLTFALVAVATVNSPLFILGIVLLLVLGVFLIRLGVEATRPVLRRVLTAPQRGE